jgi:pimeloyl-ACP methyl ester carboxylesterase
MAQITFYVLRFSQYTLPMPYITIQKQRVFYSKQGKGRSGMPALLLIHGAGGNHLVWASEIRRLPNVEVYALDLPGHEKSEGPGRDTVAGYAGIIRDFITQLDLQNVVLAGHSMGGAIAQMVALQSEAQLAGLILVGTGARMFVSDKLLDQLQSDYLAAITFITKYSWHRRTQKLTVAGGKMFLSLMDHGVTYGDFLACSQFDVREQLAKISLPTLVIGADEDQMMPLKQSQFLVDNLPNAQLATIRDAGHYMIMEQPRQMVRVMSKFLEKLGV